MRAFIRGDETEEAEAFGLIVSQWLILSLKVLKSKFEKPGR